MLLKLILKVVLGFLAAAQIVNVSITASANNLEKGVIIALLIITYSYFVFSISHFEVENKVRKAAKESESKLKSKIEKL
jgi:uncharacterized membrane protein YciS (DUF1049 family)